MRLDPSLFKQSLQSIAIGWWRPANSDDANMMGALMKIDR
jgi:hypothetical protein